MIKLPIKTSFSPILDSRIPATKYLPLDLSVQNKDLKYLDLSNPHTCQTYIEDILHRKNCLVGYGGYLEERSLYKNNPEFHERNIHLGLDFWTQAGTAVLVPLDGIVHSFRNNESKGDYGPTIILKHEVQASTFYTLYGHLSISSLENLQLGNYFRKGDLLGTLGATNINVNYAPHLHFQIIINIEDHSGDYPGVCTKTQQDYYMKNCPDPNLLIGL